MIIDLTKVHNFIHEFWDAIGILFGVGFIVFIPLALILVSLIKIGEYKEAKAKQESKS